MNSVRNRLAEYISDGNLEKFRELIDQNKEIINTTDELGWALIHECAERGRMEFFSLLMEYDADPNLRTSMINIYCC